MRPEPAKAGTPNVFWAKKGGFRAKMWFLGAAKVVRDAAKVVRGAAKDFVTGPRSSSVRPRMSLVASGTSVAGQRSPWRYHGGPRRDAGRPWRDAGVRFCGTGVCDRPVRADAIHGGIGRGYPDTQMAGTSWNRSVHVAVFCGRPGWPVVAGVTGVGHFPIDDAVDVSHHFQ